MYMEWNIEIRYQGQPRRAQVRDVTTTSIEMVFKVVFDDGYQNTFFIPLGENRWTEWKRGDTVLAQVVGAAIEQAINNDRDRKDPPPTLRRKAYEQELDDDGELVNLTFVETSALGAPRQYLVIFDDGYENIFYPDAERSLAGDRPRCDPARVARRPCHPAYVTDAVLVTRW